MKAFYFFVLGAGAATGLALSSAFVVKSTGFSIMVGVSIALQVAGFILSRKEVK